MLEAGIAFLARLMRLAVVIVTRDGKPCAISSGLTRLRIEASGKGELFCEDSTIALQIILGDATRIHPQAQARIADELGHPYCLINGGILLLVPMDFVLVDQH